MRWYLSLCIGSRNSFRYAAERRGMSSALVFAHQGGEGSAEESRRGLIGRPEGRPRPERVLKDAGAPPSFRRDRAAEAGPQPVPSPVATPQRPCRILARSSTATQAIAWAAPWAV